MASLHASEPEVISELLALVQCEAPGLEGLRAHAIRALSVQVRARLRRAGCGALRGAEGWATAAVNRWVPWSLMGMLGADPDSMMLRAAWCTLALPSLCIAVGSVVGLWLSC